MPLLTRDQILGVKDIKTETVEVPEWGGSVLVRSLGAVELDELEQMNQEAQGKDERVNLRGVRARLAMLSVVDESGRRVFTQADIEALNRKSGRAVNRIVTKAQELSGVTDKDVKDMAGNSEPGPGADSPSA